MLFEKQEYQLNCVRNIVEVLKDVDVEHNDFSSLQGNLRALAKRCGYTQFSITQDKRLDVLMETGTGKTFTYIQTIFELYKAYGYTKFIVVVPRTAIKLGVIF